MNRYQQLSALAAKYSQQFFDQQRLCRRRAVALIEAYAAYLECPLADIEQVELDGNLNPTDKRVPIDGKLPLVVDRDGYWHFCWRIHFDVVASQFSAHEHVVFAIRIDEDLLSIREDREFTTKVSDLASAEPFFEHLFEKSLVGFGKSHGERTARIGFIGE